MSWYMKKAGSGDAYVKAVTEAVDRELANTYHRDSVKAVIVAHRDLIVEVARANPEAIVIATSNGSINTTGGGMAQLQIEVYPSA